METTFFDWCENVKNATRFSTSGFLHGSVSPKLQIIPLGPFRIFRKFAEIFAAQGWPHRCCWLGQLVCGQHDLRMSCEASSWKLGQLWSVNMCFRQWWAKWRLSTFDLYPWGEGHGVQGQICDILRPQLVMNRFLPLWPHRFPHFEYIHLGVGAVGGLWY